MNENRNNIIKKIENLFLNNLRYIIIIVVILIISFALLQTYNYFNLQNLKKTSIKFFNTIENNDIIMDELEQIKINDNNIYSILSTLKIIEKSNDENNFSKSNELYKELVLSDNLNNLYKSSLSAHASYTLLNASYLEKTNEYFGDISFFIDNINDDIESYYSIKKELEYLLVVAELDSSNSEYKNNLKVMELYKFISETDTISSLVKERVKKIHEFQIYK